MLEMLRRGELAPGGFLSMPQLVERLGFPLAATREAVKRAEARGLVSVLPKRGVQVMAADPRTMRDCLDMRAALEAEGVRRLLDAGAAIPLRALRAAHMEVLEAAHRASGPELPRLAQAVDRTLHESLARGLDNPWLERAHAENRDRVALIEAVRPMPMARVVPAMEEHIAIIDALSEGDAAAAIAALRTHMGEDLRWWGVAV